MSAHALTTACTRTLPTHYIEGFDDNYRLLGGGGLFVVVVLFVFCCIFCCCFLVCVFGGGEGEEGGGGFLSFLGLTMCGSLNVKLQELSN